MFSSCKITYYWYTWVVGLTLHVTDEDTHRLAKDEVPQQRWDERERHTEDSQQKVADSQIQQEQVGNGPHTTVERQCRNDQRVAGYRQYEDDRVEQYARVSVVRERRASTAAADATARRRRRVQTGNVVHLGQRQQPRRRRDVILHRLHHQLQTQRVT